MAIVEKSTGGWLDKKELKGGELAKLVSEAVEEEGQNGKQLVAQISIKNGPSGQKTSINAQSKNALIDAFGKDTKDWIGKLLTLNIERPIIGGKRVYALYMIPEGYVMTEDAGGYVVIIKKEEAEKIINVDDSEDIDPADIPF